VAVTRGARNVSSADREDLLTAAALAVRLGVKPGTVLGWHRRGWIPSRKLSPKVLRFDLVEVLAALEARPRPEGRGVAR
jgi:hypothetical protein